MRKRRRYTARSKRKALSGCGEPTFSKSGLCGKCRYNSALKAKTEKRLEEKFEEINFILENTDLENLRKRKHRLISKEAQGYIRLYSF